jgi:thiol:disulfide interchange protein
MIVRYKENIMDDKFDFDFHKLLFQRYVPKWMQKTWIQIFYRLPTWNTDYNTALAEGSLTKKIVFALFTGSDWCKPCINLHNEVLTSAVFCSWASLKVVLLKLEFLQSAVLPPALVAQNQMLMAKYNVQGFPSAIGLNSDGSERGRLGGYTKGMGPQAWLIQFETNAKMNQLPPP